MTLRRRGPKRAIKLAHASLALFTVNKIKVSCLPRLIEIPGGCGGRNRRIQVLAGFMSQRRLREQNNKKKRSSKQSSYRAKRGPLHVIN